jgi:hypothetical protein
MTMHRQQWWVQEVGLIYHVHAKKKKKKKKKKERKKKDVAYN